MRRLFVLALGLAATQVLACGKSDRSATPRADEHRIAFDVGRRSWSGDIPPEILVSIASDGTVLLDERPVRDDELSGQLVRMREANSDMRVVARVDEQAPHARAVGLLTMIQTAGLTDVVWML